MTRPIDPNSSTPLYLQIADAIRHRIEEGTLSRGESLEPLREAADSWGVSLHTVRHAYTSLARDGLLEVRRGPGGTRVRPDVWVEHDPLPTGEALKAFLSKVLERAEADFGMDPAGLMEALRRRVAATPAGERSRLWMVECSRWQCDAHAREIEALYEVDVRPWVLGERDGPPPGPALATYFHFNELRRSWPRRFAEISFVDIQVDPRLGELLRADGLRLVVCERDEPTARAVAADVLSLAPGFDRPLETVVSDDPAVVIRDVEQETRVLCPPRVWAGLTGGVRSDPRAVEIRYMLDRERIAELARHRCWEARPGPLPEARSTPPPSSRSLETTR